MGKCKHYRVTLLRRFAGSFGQACECGQHGPPDARVCSDCHAWLPLGPANDTPREVQIEIRAAEIERNYAESPKSKLGQFARSLDGAEYAGWIGHQFDSAKAPQQDGEWSGYLARAIVVSALNSIDAFRSALANKPSAAVERAGRERR